MIYTYKYRISNDMSGVILNKIRRFNEAKVTKLTNNNELRIHDTLTLAQISNVKFIDIRSPIIIDILDNK
jgi:hypothetical protein